MKSSDIAGLAQQALLFRPSLLSSDSSQPSSQGTAYSDLSSCPSDRHCFPKAIGRLAPLTVNDRTMARNLLEKAIDEGNEELMGELQYMMYRNVKAEIQAVDDAQGIAGWLDERLVGAGW